MMGSTLPEWVKKGPRRYRVDLITRSGEIESVMKPAQVDEGVAVVVAYRWCKRRGDAEKTEIYKVRADDSERLVHVMVRGPRGGVKHEPQW